MYDVIIIGGGPSGLSAAIYASRACLKTLLIEKAGCGGLMTITDMIENYPGFDSGINGFEFAMKLEAQAKHFGTEIVNDEIIEIKDGQVKKIISANKTYETKSIIIAAGTKIRKMEISGEDKFIGKGVSYCAVCDAPFFRDKNVAVIGGGDSAVQEALHLSKFAKQVTIMHRRDELRATKILQEKIKKHPNVCVMYDVKPVEVVGNEKVEKFIVSNVKTNEKIELNMDGIFVFIGMIANTTFVPFLKLDEQGYIITDENMKTSVEGIFACGDIRQKQLRQIVTAASDGAQAAISAEDYLDC